ncbi:MAG: hypothetical protein ACK5L6_11575 [Anaerorhabdus sp.]|uniref:hypothetical protein n=1 Tax=Anaerorhabdus sp. TaxID=1872524 RepID=UPI003A87BE45
MNKVIKFSINCSLILMLVLGNHGFEFVNVESHNLKPCIYDINTGKLSKDSPIPCVSKSRMIEDGPV